MGVKVTEIRSKLLEKMAVEESWSPAQELFEFLDNLLIDSGGAADAKKAVVDLCLVVQRMETRITALDARLKELETGVPESQPEQVG